MNLAEFRRRNQAQFARQSRWLRSVGLEFVGAMTEHLVKATPGVGNQKPDDTQYEPTGRLRAGWNLVDDKIGLSDKGLFAAKYEEGPFDREGDITIAKLRAQAQARVGAFGKFYVENDVGYGWLIVTGGGNHAAVGPRNWPEDTRQHMATFRSVALSRATKR